MENNPSSAYYLIPVTAIQTGIGQTHRIIDVEKAARSIGLIAGVEILILVAHKFTSFSSVIKIRYMRETVKYDCPVMDL